MLPTEHKQPNHAVRLEEFVTVQVTETAVRNCVEEERSLLFVCLSVPQRFVSAVRRIKLTFFHRTIRFNITLQFTNDIRANYVYSLPTTVPYTYLLAFP